MFCIITEKLTSHGKCMEKIVFRIKVNRGQKKSKLSTTRKVHYEKITHNQGGSIQS